MPIVHGPRPESHVRLPVMRHVWDQVTFLHWPYDADAVQRLLPRGLSVESRDGAAWVGLVPFVMHVRGPVGPAVPWVSHFPETNVRTYVRGPDGRPGIWFFSLDAGRLGAVLIARIGLGLPYVWSRMRVSRDGDVLTYRSTRGEQVGAAAPCFVRMQVGAVRPPDQMDEFDHYLTARFRLWTTAYGRLLCVDAEHSPWSLRRGRVLDLEEELLVAAGLPAPQGDPVVHFSEGVDVRIGAPRLVPH